MASTGNIELVQWWFWRIHFFSCHWGATHSRIDDLYIYPSNIISLVGYTFFLVLGFFLLFLVPSNTKPLDAWGATAIAIYSRQDCLFQQNSFVIFWNSGLNNPKECWLCCDANICEGCVSLLIKMRLPNSVWNVKLMFTMV